MKQSCFIFASFLAISAVVQARVTAPADTTLLEEVTVTAIKQGNLCQQPVASTVVSASQAERLQIVSLKGVSDVAPNFFIPDYGSRMTSSIYVRGIGARIDQPAVGLNIDNVPVFCKDAYDFDLADIAEIEMLRGPQSTLYGRNTMGGLVNITTLSPMHFRGVRAMLEYGRANSMKASASVFARPADSFGLSANIYYTRTDGFFTNAFNGRDTDHENQLSGRVKAEWRISPRLYLLNTAAASRLCQGGYPYRSIESGQIACNDTCFYRRATFSDGLTLRLTLPGVVLSSITSAQFIDDNMTLDQDFLPLPYFTLTQKRREWDYTQDFVARNSGSGWWQWLTGLFGFYRNMHMQAPVTFLDEGIARLIEDHRNSANPGYPISWDSRELLLQSRFSNPAFGVAVYHQSTFNFGDWRLTAGLRLDFERTDLRYNSDCDSGYEIFRRDDTTGSFEPYSHVPVVISESGRLHRHSLELLPRLALLYNLGTTGNLYVSVSKGYKAGGFNTQMFSDVLRQRLMGVMGIGAAYDVEEILSYKPEESWNFEAGTHLEGVGGHLRADISAFYIICRDQQLTMFPEGTTTGRVMTNAGRTRSFGGELSIVYVPIDPLRMQLGYGYTNARFTSFYNGINDYSGKYVPYAPQHTLFVGISGDVALPLLWFDTLRLAADMTGNGPVYWDEANTRRQNFYAQLGASVTLSNPRVALSLWGKNITNTHFDTFYFMSMGNEFLQNGKPWRVGVTLRINFEITN